MASLEDLERRVIALERAADRDRSVERAVAEIVAESERRTTIRLNAVEQRLTAKVEAAEQRMAQRVEEAEQRMAQRVEESEQRMATRAEAAERRMIDILNERFDAVMTAIDRLRP
jgi:DNA anti-recombination protein RmuC